MLPDFEMIIHKFPDGQDITIIPIADVHLGARECMEQEFIKFIDSIKDKPNVYLVLGGDLINNSTRSSVGNGVFEETMRPADQKKEMAKILAPVSHKVLAAVGGNHEARSKKDADDDVTYDILCKIDREDVYRENMAFIKIQFGDRKMAGNQRPTYTLCLAHGAGGGALTGAGLNKTERMSAYIDNLDAFISGHTHRPAITQPGKIYIDTKNNKVTVKPFKVITATSWLSTGGYSLQKLMTPTSHALQTLTLCGDHKEMVVTM